MISVNIRKKMSAFSLEVQFQAEREALALLGASGCGKSVTLKCVAGILTPDEGRIELDGQVLYDSAARINLPPQRRNVGYLPLQEWIWLYMMGVLKPWPSLRINFAFRQSFSRFTHKRG